MNQSDIGDAERLAWLQSFVQREWGIRIVNDSIDARIKSEAEHREKVSGENPKETSAQ